MSSQRAAVSTNALPRSTLETIAHQMVDAATMHLSRDGYVALAPISIKNGKTIPVQVDPSMDKPAIAALLRRFAKNSDAIVIIDEAYISTVAVNDGDDLENIRERVAPSNRKEGFFVSVQSPAGEYMAVFEFGRTVGGEPNAPRQYYRGWVDEQQAPLATNFQGLFVTD